MTSSINPINVNTQGVGAKIGFGAKPKQEKELEAKQETQAGTEQKSAVSADKVLDFMAAGATQFVARKTVDPSKYVDEASAKRIADLMGSFEDKVAEGLKAFDKEFATAGVSDSAKMAVVLGKIDKETV